MLSSYTLLCLTTTLSYPQPVDNFRTERIGPAGEKLKNTKTGPREDGMSLSFTVVERVSHNNLFDARQSRGPRRRLSAHRQARTQCVSRTCP